MYGIRVCATMGLDIKAKFFSRLRHFSQIFLSCISMEYVRGCMRASAIFLNIPTYAQTSSVASISINLSLSISLPRYFFSILIRQRTDRLKLIR